MRVPDFKRDFKDYNKFDIGAMGEFDVAVLIEQYADKKVSKKMYPEWRGGYYYAAKPKADTAAPLALLYVSRWSSDDSAAAFAGIYAASLKERYKKLNGTADRDSSLPPSDPKGDSSPAPLQGRHAWTSEEGTIVIEQKGDTVLVSESLDPGTTSALEGEVFGAAAK
jgi:hypothetical protein